MQIGTRVAINASYGPCHIGKEGTIIAVDRPTSTFPIEVKLDTGECWIFEERELDIL